MSDRLPFLPTSQSRLRTQTVINECAKTYQQEEEMTLDRDGTASASQESPLDDSTSTVRSFYRGFAAPKSVQLRSSPSIVNWMRPSLLHNLTQIRHKRRAGKIPIRRFETVEAQATGRIRPRWGVAASSSTSFYPKQRASCYCISETNL